MAKPHELLIDRAISQGGTTITANGSELQSSYGYIVGGKVPTLVNPATYGQVDNWLRDNPSPYYGSWRDTRTGIVHIDAVDVVAHIMTAISLAAQRREIAIWDIHNGQEVRL